MSSAPASAPDNGAAPSAPAATAPGRTRFESELQVRPDDIDMNAHVHASKYFDYVLAARYDQMARCYKMSMEEFIKAGYGWFARNTFIEYKRPLGMGDSFIVRTWLESFQKDTVRVDFQIVRKATGKLSADGYAHFTLINLKTGRAETIPDWIIEKYAV
jgi:acyl-CoA thioester hydrolase/thioesterase-3